MICTLPALAAIERLKADTGTGGLYNGGDWNIISGAYFTLAAPGTAQVYPYIVITASADYDDTMVSDDQKCTIGISVFGSAIEGVEKLHQVAARIWGDAVLQTGRAPTYGLHRHRLVLSNSSTLNPWGAVASEMYVTNQMVVPDGENVIKLDMTLTVHMSAVAANP